MLGALYGAGYLAGGERLLRPVLRHFGPAMKATVLGFGDIVVVSDPGLAKQVLTAPPDVLLGGKGVGPAEAIYGPGSMFVQEEPEHLRRRKLLIPPLHGSALNGYAPVIERATKKAMRSWPTDRPFPMLDAARHLMLDVIVKVIFGVDDPVEVRRIGGPFERLLDLGVSEQVTLRYALRRAGALRWWPELAKVNHDIDQTVRALIRKRRTDPQLGERHHVLAVLMRATDEDGNGLSDSEIRDDLITLMLAGHETTATTLAWLMDLLLHHPASLARVRAEAINGDATYTTAVINETLRLRPPVPFTGRYAAAPFRMGNHTVAPGTHIVVHINAINHHPETYAEPDEFRPERFLDAKPQTYAWLPFGGGIKRCIGANFSMLELQTVLHTMLRHGDFQPAHERQERVVRQSVVLVPKNGTRVLFHPNPQTSGV
ncbi:cytochrome P450 [Mycobacterium sp. CBMA 623]|nr:cytochrome P450 [Mycobacteroides sp. CBMA 326]